MLDRSTMIQVCVLACASFTGACTTPTLFLHGLRDQIVAIDQMKPYRDELEYEGHVVETGIDDVVGHEWLAAAVSAIRIWFDDHR